MAEKKKVAIRDIAQIGLMAAACFVATNFRIVIPTPVGNTMLHFGNVFVLLSGLLFGGVKGGLAGGIGSMFFDLFDPIFISSAPITLINKFMMGFIAGKIAYSKGKNGDSLKYNMIGAALGAVVYIILYLLSDFIKNYFFLGNAFETVLVATGSKSIVSSVNAFIAVVVSVILAPIFKASLRKAKILK